MSYRQYVKWRLDEEVPFPVYESAVEAMMADISAKAASLAYFRVCDEEGRSDGTYALIARCKDPRVVSDRFFPPNPPTRHFVAPPLVWARSRGFFGPAAEML